MLGAALVVLAGLAGVQAMALFSPSGLASGRTPGYLALTVTLALAASVGRVVAARSAARGLGVFGWAVLVCIEVMIEIDAARGPARIPWTVLAPLPGVLALGVFGSRRAMTWYAGGCAGLLLRAGSVYGAWGDAWVGLAALGVFVTLGYRLAAVLVGELESANYAAWGRRNGLV